MWRKSRSLDLRLLDVNNVLESRSPSADGLRYLKTAHLHVRLPQPGRSGQDHRVHRKLTSAPGGYTTSPWSGQREWPPTAERGAFWDFPPGAGGSSETHTSKATLAAKTASAVVTAR